MADIPIQLQASNVIFVMNEALISFREEYDRAISRVLSGTVPAKKQFDEVLTSLTNQIRDIKNEVEYYVIPKDQRADFDAGTVARSPRAHPEHGAALECPGRLR